MQTEPGSSVIGFATTGFVIELALRSRHGIEARRINESLSNSVIELFETARVYLPQEDQRRFGCTEEALASGVEVMNRFMMP